MLFDFNRVKVGRYIVIIVYVNSVFIGGFLIVRVFNNVRVVWVKFFSDSVMYVLVNVVIIVVNCLVYM